MRAGVGGFTNTLGGYESLLCVMCYTHGLRGARVRDVHTLSSYDAPVYDVHIHKS